MTSLHSGPKSIHSSREATLIGKSVCIINKSRKPLNGLEFFEAVFNKMILFMYSIDILNIKHI